MRVHGRRFVLIFLSLLALDAAAFAFVFVPRTAIDDDGWAFLERQRPFASSPGSFFLCHDCLNFAVFRRGIGGWETASAKTLELANLPGFAAAQAYFRNRQRQPTGTSQEHSDAATLILVMISTSQCALLALPASLRRNVPARVRLDA